MLVHVCMCMHACGHMFGWVCLCEWKWCLCSTIASSLLFICVFYCTLLVSVFVVVSNSDVCVRLWWPGWPGCTLYSPMHCDYQQTEVMVCLCSTLPWSLAQCSECQELVGGPQCVHWRRLLGECTPSVEICNFVVFFPRRRASFDSLLSGWTR